ncbi:MAG: NYN domain-containing protein [Lachnospiraceae bacterium]
MAGGQGSIIRYHNINVVYTKEAETADQYIEKLTNEIGKKYNVIVATSDSLEQMIVWGQGATRLSARGLREEVEYVNKEIRKKYSN